MKSFILITLLLIVKTVVTDDHEAPITKVQVIETYSHDDKAFTQGLFWESEGNFFYEGTGIVGQSTIRKVNLNGTVEKLVPLEHTTNFGEGIARAQDLIYQLTWRNNVVYIYSLNLTLLHEKLWQKEGWGLTYDGTNLIVSDGTSTIYFVDDDFRIKREIVVKNGDHEVKNLNELEYINGEIWANVWNTWEIVRIDPETGTVKQVVNCTELKDKVHPSSPQSGVLNGIAYDSVGKRVFLTGKLWDKLFQVKVIEPEETKSTGPTGSTGSIGSTGSSTVSTGSTGSTGSSTGSIVVPKKSKTFLIFSVFLIIILAVLSVLLWRQKRTKEVIKSLFVKKALHQEWKFSTLQES